MGSLCSCSTILCLVQFGKWLFLLFAELTDLILPSQLPTPRYKQRSIYFRLPLAQHCHGINSNSERCTLQHYSQVENHQHSARDICWHKHLCHHKPMCFFRIRVYSPCFSGQHLHLDHYQRKPRVSSGSLRHLAASLSNDPDGVLLRQDWRWSFSSFFAHDSCLIQYRANKPAKVVFDSDVHQGSIPFLHQAHLLRWSIELGNNCSRWSVQPECHLRTLVNLSIPGCLFKPIHKRTVV